MIVGIGTDIVDVDRIRKACQKQVFFEKNFSRRENDMFAQKKDAQESVAANFAAKEAFLKALGVGIFDGIALRDIEVLRTPAGKPYIVFAKPDWNYKVHVSLSHEHGYAVAFVVIED